MTKQQEIFCLTLPLTYESWQRDKLDKIFRVCNDIENALIAERLKALRQIERTRIWRANWDEIRSLHAEKDKCDNDPQIDVRLRLLYRQRQEILSAHHFSEHDFQALIKKYRSHYGSLVHSQIAQNLATAAWKRFERYLYGKARNISFSSSKEFRAISGKVSRTGIRYLNGTILINGLTLHVCFSRHDPYRYEKEAMSRGIHFCRITRRWYKDGWHYFAQLILDGTPPIKVRPDTGEVLYPLGRGRVGCVVTPELLAAVGADTIRLVRFANTAQDIENRLNVLNGEMSRSLRMTNPAHYDPKSGAILTKNRLPKELLDRQGQRIWIKSKRCLRIEAEIRARNRQKNERLRQRQNELANRLISLGNSFYVQSIDFQKAAKRHTEGEPQYGRMINRNAPGTFNLSLKQKVLRAGGEFQKIDVSSAAFKLFFIDPETGKEDRLAHKLIMVHGQPVETELYSAFLLRYVNDQCNGFDEAAISAKLPDFLTLYNSSRNMLR